MAHTKVTKTYSQNTGVANTFSYSGSFDTFKATEVVVELDNVALTYTASTINESASPREYTVDYTNKTVHIGGADLSSGTVVIKPETDLGSPTPRAEFSPGASITSADLNNNQKQLLRRAMEYEEQVMFKTGGTFTGTVEIGEDQVIKFEGATADGYETTLTVTDPTADRTITLPNVTGTVVTTGDTATVTATMLAANSVDSSELVDGSIDPSHIASSAVTTGKIAADAVTGAKIADDAIDSEHYTDGSIDTAHIGAAQVTTAKLADDAVTTAKITDGNVTTAKIAADAITAAKIADDVVNSEHYAAASIDTEHIADSQVTTAKIAADAITGAKIADDAIDSEHYTDGSIDTAHIGDNQVTTAKIADAAITTTKLANGDVAYEKLDNNSVRRANILDGEVLEGKLADDAVTADKLASNAVVNASIASNAAIDLDKLAAVSSGNVIVGNGSNVATSVAMSGDVAIAAGGATTIQANAVEIGMIGCEQTTISDSDSHIPTSGAVVDYVAAQIAPIGGLEVIADDESFPNTIPAAGVVISITDAAGLQINSSGVSTNGDTLDNSTVTINGFPSALRGGVGGNADPYVLGSGSGLMVQSTGSSQTYNYHKALLKESDYVQLSDDINDFNSRYRIAGSAPGSDNDEGDLYFDTGTNKMYVYDGSSWGEVTSTGDFKYLVLCVFNSGTGNAGVINGSISKYDLRETSTSGSLASVTSAAQLMVSVNGVVQKPNTGTAISSNDGFCMVDGHTIEFGANIPSGAEVFVIQSGSALTINTPGDGTVTSAKFASGAVNLAAMAVNSIDSDQYVDGSIDHVHLAADCVDGDNLADNACDSEHYTDGSIDHVHLANDCVDGDNIADNSVGLAAMAHATDGVIITFDANGAPAYVGPGNDGQVLTSTGSGSPPAFEDAAAGVTSDGQNNTVAGTNAGDSFTGTDANHNSLFGKDAGTAITTGDYNTAVGSGALITCATGSGNTAMGWKALEMCESGGEYNTAIGYAAGEGLSTGDNNIAIGASALDATVTGSQNIAVGNSSLSTCTSGASNTAVGNQTLQNLTTSGNNVAVGNAAMNAMVDGGNNIAIGYQALDADQSANNNIAIGYDAMTDQNNSGSGNNIALGYEAFKGANTGDYNYVIGGAAMSGAATTGAYNIAFGNRAMKVVTSGNNNIGIGRDALYALTTDTQQIAIGNYAMDALQNNSGEGSIAIGYNALGAMTGGGDNIAIGSGAGQDLQTAGNNIHIGSLAGENVTTGDNNVAIGFKALQTDTTHYGSVCVGSFAGRDSTDNCNTFVGFKAGMERTDGAGNTAVGGFAMYDGAGDGPENTAIGYGTMINTTTGHYNTCVGNSAGNGITSGANNMFLGFQAGTGSSPVGNVTTASNDICLGNNNIDNLYCVDDSISTSDQRDKTDITDFTYGLKWINKLRPITYRWDMRSWYVEDKKVTQAQIDNGEYEQGQLGITIPTTTAEVLAAKPDGSKKKTKQHLGFVAQEVLEIEKEDGFGTNKDNMLLLNLNEDESSYGMKYARLVPVLVNAIKELSTKNDALEARIATLEAG